MRQLHKQSTGMLLAGLAMGLLVGVGMMIGTLVAVRSAPSAGLPFPETLLHATASHSGNSMAMATGYIDEEVEGVFILDYLKGDFQCYVINPRYPTQWSGLFKYNVIRDLGIEQGKDPNYVMVTGHAQFIRGTGVQTPAATVVYVMDANSGHFAAYGLAWNRTMARGPNVQTGTLTLLQQGKARTLEIRQ